MAASAWRRAVPRAWPERPRTLCFNRPWSSESPPRRPVESGRTPESLPAPETPLVRHLKARIRVQGALSVASYMREILTNPLAGYYMHRDVFGSAGDFITSPEISQVFGELLAVWTVAVLRSQPNRGRFQLVELGPGRATLLTDMLRVCRAQTFRRFPDIASQLDAVHLVEVSPTLRESQRSALVNPHLRQDRSPPPSPPPPVGTAEITHARTADGTAVHWHARLADVPQGPSVIVAHEFLDALPVHQFQEAPRGASVPPVQKTAEGWSEILVDVDDGPSRPHHFRFVLSKTPTLVQQQHLPAALERLGQTPQIGDIVEVSPATLEVQADLASRCVLLAAARAAPSVTAWALGAHHAHPPASRSGPGGGPDRIATHGGAALVIDYGHDRPGLASAIRSHRFQPILDRPGEADLSADVDFSSLRDTRVRVSGPTQQGAFLLQLGLQARVTALLQAAKDASQARDLLAASERLVLGGEAGMGSIYKGTSQVLAYTPLESPAPPGFHV